MKNLMLLMMTILLVNVSVYADDSMDDGLGASETHCKYMNGNREKVSPVTEVEVEATAPASSQSN